MSSEGIAAPTGQEAVVVPDRREALVAAFDKLDSTEPVDRPGADKPVEAAPGDRARDPSGRFVAKDPAPTQVEEPAEPQPWASAPKSWKKELAEGWSSLPPNYQQYVHEREAQMRSGIEPLLPKAQLAEQIEQAAAPYMRTIQGLGLDLPRAISGLMSVDHQLRTLPYEQKLQVLAQTAMAYGIDLTGQMQQAQQVGGNPYMQQTAHEIIQLRGEMEDFKRAQEAQLEEAALEQIQSFSQTAEFFDEAKPTMQLLLQRGMASGIKDAYEKALRLDPDLFDKVQSARQAQTTLEKSKAADAAAKAAKAAAVSPKSATPGASKPASAQDRRSVIREALDSLSERL